MNKRLLAVIVACVLIVTAFAGCNTAKPADNQPTKEPAKVTDAPKATDVPVVTEAPAPTEVPTEAPTKEPKPTMDTGGIDAIIFDLEEGVIENQACNVGISDEGPWLSIVTDIGDNWVVFHFDEGFETANYPFIAFKYRLGYGQSIRNTNHFYSINEVSHGPDGKEGLWSDITWTSDLDWHTGTLNLAEQFAAAEGAWTGIRFPTPDTRDGELAIAWLGAFKSEEDIAKYDAAFNASYGSQLVKAEKPDENDKEEDVPILDDEFDEMVLDFEDFDDSASMAGLDYDMYAYCVGANGSKIIDIDGNLVANISFDALYYNGIIKSGAGYTCTFKYKDDCVDTNFGGFIFNWGDEQNTTRNLFENNGLEGDGRGSLVSPSGCGVFFMAPSKIKVYIPVWDLEANKKSYISTIIETDVDFKTNFVNIKVEDNGTDTVTVTANDTVLFKVVYDDPGVINAALGYSEGYYRNTKIVDASGTELAGSTSALFSKYKSFGWAGRAHGTYVDDIQIVNKK